MKDKLQAIAYELFAHIAIAIVMAIMVVCFLTPQ